MILLKVSVKWTDDINKTENVYRSGENIMK